MKIAMTRLLGLLALLLVPGALLAAGLIAAFRYLFHGEDRLTEETVRRINADAAKDAKLREIDEVRRGKRTVLDGPRMTRAHSRPWGGR